ncbi:hypothetical protein EVA_00753 [gut metagenome]|uniref:Uncharacterized protein n=1 Tax=gut metagenome TaxID=749906 RepID=J9DCH1_9ZZZZ
MHFPVYPLQCCTYLLSMHEFSINHPRVLAFRQLPA